MSNPTSPLDWAAAFILTATVATTVFGPTSLNTVLALIFLPPLLRPCLLVIAGNLDTIANHLVQTGHLLRHLTTRFKHHDPSPWVVAVLLVVTFCASAVLSSRGGLYGVAGWGVFLAFILYLWAVNSRPT